MSKLLMALKVGSVCGRTIGVSHPPEELATYTREAWDIGFAQGFIWYPHYVLFFPPGELGSYWVEIYISDTLELQPETILVDEPELGLHPYLISCTTISQAKIISFLAYYFVGWALPTTHLLRRCKMSVNQFDGKKVITDLSEHTDLWASFLFTKPIFAPDEHGLSFGNLRRK